VSTEEVRRILADGSAIVLDSRKRSEYVAGHIAGAQNVAPEAGAPPAATVAAVERLAGGDNGKALVLYCNGPHCQASRQLAEQLVAAGFTNVRRYQSGIPMWRELSGPVEIQSARIQRFSASTGPPCFRCARPEDYAKGSLAGAHNVPGDGSGWAGWRRRCRETI
jgi:rhodanese-related sulfurtransferase